MRTLMGILAVFCFVCGCTGAQEKSQSEIRGPDFYYGLAVNNYYDQNAQGALRELDTCFKLAPKHVKAHHLAGLIYMGRKEYVDALTHLQRALELDPDFHIARANLGALYVEMQQWHNALEMLSPLLHESAYDTPYLVENNLGWIYFNLKDYSEAERHYRRAILLNDKMCLAYNNLGILRFTKERFEEAEDAFSAAIKRCPEFVEAHFRSGTVLERLGRYQEASKLFKKCEKLGGESLYGRRCKQKLQATK